MVTAERSSAQDGTTAKTNPAPQPGSDTQVQRSPTPSACVQASWRRMVPVLLRPPSSRWGFVQGPDQHSCLSCSPPSTFLKPNLLSLRLFALDLELT